MPTCRCLGCLIHVLMFHVTASSAHRGRPSLAAQTDVGIRRQHGQNIVRHLAEMHTDGKAAAAALANPKRRITLCVEGNISAGKSSFLQRILKGSVELRDIVEVRTCRRPPATHVPTLSRLESGALPTCVLIPQAKVLSQVTLNLLTLNLLALQAATTSSPARSA